MLEFSWVESPWAVRRLRHTLVKYCLESVRKRFGFLHGFESGADGSKSDLCIVWKDGVEVSLCSFSNSFIDVLVCKDEESIC